MAKPGLSKRGKRSGVYDQAQANAIWWLNICGILFWLLLIWLFNLYRNIDPIVLVILLLPVLLFIISMYNSTVLTYEVEDYVFQNNYLTLGLLVVIPLLSWMGHSYNGDRQRFIGILVIAIILSMLSTLDIWVTSEWITAVKHLRSILEVLSVILLVYAFYTYYLEYHPVMFTKYS